MLMQSNVTRDGDGQLNDDKKNVSMNLISIKKSILTRQKCIMRSKFIWRKLESNAVISSFLFR